MFKIGYTKRCHAFVFKELRCTQFFLSCIFGIDKITGRLEEKNCEKRNKMGRMHKIGIIKIVTQKRESEEKFNMTIK